MTDSVLCRRSDRWRCVFSERILHPIPVHAQTSASVFLENREEKRGRGRVKRQGTPWLAGSRRFRPSRRMPRGQRRRRNSREPIRRLQPKRRWSTPALCAGLRCQTPRHSSNILRVSTPSHPCLQSWWMCRPKDKQTWIVQHTI